MNIQASVWDLVKQWIYECLMIFYEIVLEYSKKNILKKSLLLEFKFKKMNMSIFLLLITYEILYLRKNTLYL